MLSAGDFAAYNLRLDGSGRLIYMEPPSKLKVVAAYRDLAWLLESLGGAADAFRRDVVRSYSTGS